MKNIKRIEMERLMFGDFRVQVWDENNNSLLDREYFCRGRLSASLTACEIRTLPGFKKLPIYSQEGPGEPVLLDEYKETENE